MIKPEDDTKKFVKIVLIAIGIILLFMIGGAIVFDAIYHSKQK